MAESTLKKETTPDADWHCGIPPPKMHNYEKDKEELVVVDNAGYQKFGWCQMLP